MLATTPQLAKAIQEALADAAASLIVTVLQQCPKSGVLALVLIGHGVRENVVTAYLGLAYQVFGDGCLHSSLFCPFVTDAS